LLFTADDGCNTCTCPESGDKNASACTQMTCPPPLGAVESCIPLVVFPAGDGINTCTCPWSGLKSEAHCTDFSCPEAPEPTPTKPPSSASGGEGTCCPGLLFAALDGCNTCACPSSGNKSEAECTHATCYTWVDGPASEDCLPSTTFPAGDGFNICTCPASGKKSDGICSHLSCPTEAPVPTTAAPEEEQGTCCPGVLFPASDRCNTCTCAATGLMSDPFRTPAAQSSPARRLPGLGRCQKDAACPSWPTPRAMAPTPAPALQVAL